MDLAFSWESPAKLRNLSELLGEVRPLPWQGNCSRLKAMDGAYLTALGRARRSRPGRLYFLCYLVDDLAYPNESPGKRKHQKLFGSLQKPTASPTEVLSKSR